MAKYKFKIYSPYVGADVVEEVEIPDEKFEGLTEDDKESYLNEVVRDWMLHTIEWGWEEVEE
ncbi:DUF7167 family protein [Paenibacillus sp. SN-8-1]|uniref:DUF7167 family protein n=1 Tax=Paenibacillus sp. SN-8-1 TaxID=3435409 RepID=UPI003D9AA8E6